MIIGYVINDIATEKDHNTTVQLAMQAQRMGHRVLLMGVADLCYTADGRMGAKAYEPPARAYRSGAAFMAACRKVVPQRISSADLDVLMLRNDPSDDLVQRPWAQQAGIIFGEVAATDGVLVLNDPASLAGATNKMYFQHFPSVLRPRTLITRDVEEIRAFFTEQDQRMILKPLQGSGGRNVFRVNDQNIGNLNQIIEAICRDGYVIAQEYLPDAKDGDVRLFVMNGAPLQRDGKYAAFRRVNAKADIRSNLKAGATPTPVKVTDTMLELVEVVRPKLMKDGMFLVGLDIVGDKLMEINVFSPGGLLYIVELEHANFYETIIQAVEKKHHYKQLYGERIRNKLLATM